MKEVCSLDDPYGVRAARMLLRVQQILSGNAPSAVDKLMSKLGQLIAEKGVGGADLDEIIEYMIEGETIDPNSLLQHLSCRVSICAGHAYSPQTLQNTVWPIFPENHVQVLCTCTRMPVSNRIKLHRVQTSSLV